LERDEKVFFKAALKSDLEKPATHGKVQNTWSSDVTCQVYRRSAHTEILKLLA
jgi:hypothetical protein